MYSRRFACFIVGIWLAGGLFLFWSGRESARAADVTLSEPNPNVTARIKPLGREDVRLLLHHAAAQQFRMETQTWETAQLLLGISFFFFLLFGTREGKLPLALALLMVAILVAQKFVLTPEISGLGRITDFLPAAAHSPDRTRLTVLSGAYSAFEFVKWGAQIALCAVLIGSRRWLSGDAGQKFNLVDKADHRHIYR